jgi:hypothetical protein
MSKINVEYQKRSIKSVLLDLEAQVSGLEFEFSLQHVTCNRLFLIKMAIFAGEKSSYRWIRQTVQMS